MDDAQTAMDVEDVYELSPMQLGMLFQSLLAPESGVFFEQQVIRISAEFHSVAFERAWQMLVDRTPVLRASFHWEGLEKPVQVVHRRVAVPVEYLDWRSVPPAAQSDRLGDYLRVVRRTGFDFATAPLMRIALIDLGGTEFLFVWHFHHILLDGWSGQLVLQELVEQYAALCGGADFTPPQRPPFSDYIAWLQRQDFDKAEAYWRDLLRDFTTPTPLGIGRPPVDGEARSGFEGELVVTLSADQSEALRGFARRNRLTLNTLLQAAWALLLSRYSGETDIVYGTVVSGRPTDLPGVEMMIGLFINTLPMRVATPADAELVSWLKDLQQRQVEASQYQYVSLLQIQRWSALPSGTDLFDTVLIFENFPTAPVARNGETAEAAEPIYLGRTNVPISILVIPGSCLRLKFVFDERRFTAESIERVGAHLRMLLEHFLARPNAQLGSISVLSPDERHRILVEWNATAMVGFEEKSLVALLAEQVWRAPDAVAFYCGEESVTLRSLDDRSSQLASYLINRGIGHGSIVGVCLERSIEAAIAFLAILKARAVYLPLDPSYPPSRLAYMLDDAGATLVLTKDDAASWTSRTLVVDLAAERPVIDGCDAACPMPHPAPDDIAYVIYTSGSTGRPKGVLAQHRQILNRLFWMWQAYPFAPGEVGAVRTALNFVDSFWELLGALLRGVPSVILRERDVRDLRHQTVVCAIVSRDAAQRLPRHWSTPAGATLLVGRW